MKHKRAILVGGLILFLVGISLGLALGNRLNRTEIKG